MRFKKGRSSDHLESSDLLGTPNPGSVAYITFPASLPNLMSSDNTGFKVTPAPIPKPQLQSPAEFGLLGSLISSSTVSGGEKSDWPPASQWIGCPKSGAHSFIQLAEAKEFT